MKVQPLISRHRLTSLALTLAILVAGAAALYAILARAGSSSSETPQQANVVQSGPPSPTPTIAIPAENDRDAAIGKLRGLSPAIPEAVAAVESGNFDAMVPFLAWKSFPCTAADARGGVAPRCTDLGVAEGTEIPMFHYEIEDGSYFTQSQLKERFSSLLSGKHPQLGLAAVRPDGTVYLSFTLDSSGPREPRGVDVTVSVTEGESPLVGYRDRFTGASAIGTIQTAEAMSGTAFDVLYVSDAMLAWQQDAQRLKDSANATPPAGH
ncbi:MAG TPA: hypothetical protein VJQ83_04245 [Tepidiformaceae bacterium]|nr:hypothetical protein [Tepidiformaceae bacterium]